MSMARKGEKRNVFSVFVGKPVGEGNFEDHGGIILNWILKE